MKPIAKPWLLRSVRLVELGMQDQLRRRSFRLFMLVAAISGLLVAVRSLQDAAATAVWIAENLGRPASVLACVWFGAYACRDQSRGHQTVLRARAVDGAYLAGIRWLTGTCLWIILLALPFVTAAVVQVPFSGTNALVVHGVWFFHTSLLVCSLGALAFATSLLLRSGVAGLLVGLASALLMFKPLPGLTLQPDYTQNAGWVAALAALGWSAAVLLIERKRRGELRKPAVPAGIVLALFLAAAAATAQTLTRGLPAETTSLWDGIAGQSLAEHQPLPGFWLPDGQGGMVKTSDHPGKILVICLFKPGDLSGTGILRNLDRIQSEYAGSGVQAIGVAVTGNPGSGNTAAKLGGYRFPIGLDLSETDTRAGRIAQGSVMMHAYRATGLPLVVVTDRSHRVTAIHAVGGLNQERLRDVVDERIAAEPVAPTGSGAH